MAEENSPTTRQTLRDFAPSAIPPLPLPRATITPTGGVDGLQDEFKPLAHSRTNKNSNEEEPDDGGGGGNHPWKVAFIEETATAGTYSWSYVGDSVWSQGGELPVASGSVSGSGKGYIVLEVTRDASSRVLSGATVTFIEFGAGIPNSDEATQYRILAVVDPTLAASDMVLQYEFSEIRIWELMIVANGEFALMGAEISHRNTYATP